MQAKLSLFILFFYLFFSTFEVPLLHAENNHPETTASEDEYSVRSEKAEKFVFKKIPHHIAGTFKESFYSFGSLALVLAAGASAGIAQKDKSISASFPQNHYLGNTTNKVLDQLGAPYTLLGGSIVSDIIAHKTHNKKLKTTSESLIESLLISETLTYGLKFAFRRDRPDGTSLGFPSAHSAGAFSSATVLQKMYGIKAGIPAYALASLIAFSRVDSKKHFVSDVVFGAALGGVIGYGSAQFHLKEEKKYSLKPWADGKSAGLLLYRDF